MTWSWNALDAEGATPHLGSTLLHSLLSPPLSSSLLSFFGSLLMIDTAACSIFGEEFGVDDGSDDEHVVSADALDVPLQPIVLTDFQKVAVKEGSQKICNELSQLVHGGVGSGKTVVSIETIKSAVRQTPTDSPVQVLVVTPSAGQNLPRQWTAEIRRQGVDEDEILSFADRRFSTKAAAWEERMRRSADEMKLREHPLFVLTTFHALHADVDKVHGEGSYLLRTRFQYLVVDEGQFYRNGSHKMKEEDVDPEKKMYSSIMRVRDASRPRVLVLSATPFFNDRCDVYSLVVLMGAAGGRKRAWMRDANNADWKQQKRWFTQNHVTCIAVPESVQRAADLRRLDHEGLLSSKEIELTYDAYGNMKPCIERVLSILQDLSTVGGGAQQAALLQALDAAFKVFLGQLVRCRRGLLHPAFFDPPITRVLPDGKQVALPVPLERYEDFALEECSKFNALIALLKTMSGRVVITSQFSRPLDFLQLHIRRLLPEWVVLLHHGKANCVKALERFKEEGETRNVAMLVTMGSCGEGINLSMTTRQGKDAVRMVCLDLPFSNSAQQQMEGRIKRPLAQPDVTTWYVHRVFSAAIVADRNAGGSVKHDTVDQALLKVLANKEHGADEVFMSDEELQAQAGKTRASSYGANAGAKMRPLLRAMLDVCCQWERTEKKENVRTRHLAKEQRKRAREDKTGVDA